MSRSKFVKHFVHPYSSPSREQRRRRFFDRSSLLLSHPYSIRIELYRARRDEQPGLIAVWNYPLPFAHLPVTRLAKVLHLTESLLNPCSSSPCPHPNSRCQQLMNNKSQFLCLCKNNFHGENCSEEDLRCRQGYCSRGSLCQPNSRDSLPFCLCPFNRFGVRCEIEHDGCLSNPCLHGGSCLPDVQPDRVICLCRKEYSGSLCQSRRLSIDLSLSINTLHRGAVIQYLQIDFISLRLNLVDQQVFRTLPKQIEYFHGDLKTTLPDIVLAKLYSSHEDFLPDLYLLSVQEQRSLRKLDASTFESSPTVILHFFQISLNSSLSQL